MSELFDPATVRAWRAWLVWHGPVSRILLTGSRTWPDTRPGWWLLHEVLMSEHLSADAVLVEGEADGADTMAAALWRGRRRRVEPHPLPARWWELGRRIPLARDQQMVDAGADVCVAFCRDHSRGTTATIGMAVRAEIPTFVFRA